MKLYHGTRERYLTSILRYGIRPRKRRKGNWEKYPGRTDVIYLTSCYPFLFALYHGHPGRALVLEIDTAALDKTKLFPDEDFLIQAKLGDEEDSERITETHRVLREQLHHYPSLWRNSIKSLGTCCYQGTVPPAAITRYCLFDPAERRDLEVICTGPSIQIHGHSVNAKKHNALVRWFFGDRRGLISDVSADFRISGAQNEVTRALAQKLRDQVAAFQRESKDRKGIEVVVLKK